MARSNNFQVRVTGDTTKFDAAMSKAQQELRGFSAAAKSAFAVVGITSFAAAFASAAGTIADFERANSELAAVLGTTLDGIEDLTKSAKELGRTTEFTASEVTQLQIALSRLGFDRGQIKDMQESVLNFALAMGTDLASAADFTGSALRAFGLDAKDTGDLLDVMSAATTNSALDFSKLQTSISIVAPIAKAFGLDVKETAAFVGVLANNGFDASSASTALRNILLNLADANGKLASGIGHSAKSFEEIITSFKELKDRGVDVAEVLGMTDKRSAAAAITIIDQADAVSELKGKLDEANGSLQQMADTMHDNLIGSTNALSSAWEGFILSLEDSKGPMKWVVDRLTDIVLRLTDIIEGAQNLSAWEVILGPIAGGAIAQNISSKKSTDDGLPHGGGVGGGSRGGNESSAAETPTTPPSPKMTAAQLRALEKERKEMMKEGGRIVEEMMEEIQAFIDLTAVPLDKLSGIDGKAVGLSVKLEGYDEYMSQVKELSDVTRATINAVNDGMKDLAATAAEAFGELVADLINGENAWSNFGTKSLSALGSFMESVGKAILQEGIAIEAAVLATKTLQGVGAIAAGAALIAIGAALKKSLQNASSGNYSASSSVASSTYRGSSSSARDYSSRELNVKVTGTLAASGSQLVAVLNNEQTRKSHTS